MHFVWVDYGPSVLPYSSSKLPLKHSVLTFEKILFLQRPTLLTASDVLHCTLPRFTHKTDNNVSVFLNISLFSVHLRDNYHTILYCIRCIAPHASSPHA